MPLETVTITIQTGSANPQTKNVVINVDPVTGAGSGTVSFTGNNGGLDSIKATGTIAGTAYTSNLAEVAWQATNGVISLVSNVLIECRTHPDNCEFRATDPTAPIVQSLTNKNTLIINQIYNNFPIAGIISPDGNSGEYKHYPPYLDDVKSDGTALTTTGTLLSAWPKARCVFELGSIVIAQAGIHTFYFLVDDDWGFYVGGGATRNSGTYNLGNGFQTPLTASAARSGTPAYPLMGTRNPTGGSGSFVPWDYVRINFPAPGVYPFLIWWTNNDDSQAYLTVTAAAGLATLPSGSYQPGSHFGGVLKPVALQAAPPATVPAGNLQLAIQNGNLQVAGQTVTLQVSVNGIHYTTKPYIPIWEGQTGKVYLYNDPSNPTFTFPSFPSEAAVDKTAAAGSVFQLSGNNGSWQGRLSVAYNDSADGKFSLKYNGNNFDSHVDLTTLQIQNDDIAWYDSTSKTFDAYVPSLNGGGNFVQIEIDYMVKPSVASVSPLTVSADGLQHIFTINLTKPFSPQQQGANNTGNVVNTPVITFPGGTVGTPTAILDGSGWLTGWTVPITVPSSTSNSTVALGLTLTGTLTRLVNDTFATGSVTYIPTATAATITLTGVAYTPPSISAFSVTPKTGTAPSYSVTVGNNETFTITVSSAFNNATTVSVWRQQHGTSTRVNMGSAVLTSSYTSGGLYYKVFSFTQAVTTAWYTVNDLGAQATDTVSGLQSSLFFDSSTYTKVTSGGGGGGGGGCPTMEMYVGETMQVSDCQVGDPLACLVHEPDHYLDQAMEGVESHAIEWVDSTPEVCYHFIAENGAEVIISGSTPVATRETLTALREGHPVEQLPTHALEIRAGMHVITDVGNGLEWSMLVETFCVGVRLVKRLYVGGRNFAAGVKPGKYIFTHNLNQIEVK